MNAKLLQSFGITEKAAKIYMAGMALGTTSVQELARKSGIKRPTVYVQLDELLKNGLFEHVSINNKKYYRAIDPRVLEERMQKNLSEFQAELPKLAALRMDTVGRPRIQVLEGEEGIKQVYREIKKARSARLWSNIGEVYGPFHGTNMEVAEALGERGAGVREIIADTKASRRYAKLIGKTIGSTYAARIATEKGIENDTIVYDSVVAIFCLQELNQFVVRIEDASIAETMRAMFEMAWKTARPLK